MLLKTFRGIAGTMPMYTNSYLIHDESTNEGVLIDTCGMVDRLYNYIENSEIKLKYIILTHCHGDHIYGLSELKRNYPNVKIVIHEKDAPGLIDDKISMCTYMDVPINFTEADILVKDNDILKIGETEIKIIYTPGHTIGSISILIEDALFSGDTIFKNGWGRTDLPTSDFRSILESIEKKLLPLADDVILYPGHGQTTIMSDEKKRYM